MSRKFTSTMLIASMLTGFSLSSFNNSAFQADFNNRGNVHKSKIRSAELKKTKEKT